MSLFKKGKASLNFKDAFFMSICHTFIIGIFLEKMKGK
ncbi:hypothetical protein BPO_0572 [Bergeyella porcorum]|uniref:Uncharacterized protein n=1 Tax=Bergeyella porcorum TaxID=1735111 RepID=A0AAU0F0J8_9FLAO